MFTDSDVDVIYITTPHNTHIEFMKKAIRNGKHILVEKSITLNSHELNEAMELAALHNVVIGEAMTIYHMPVYKKLKEILDSGRLGRVNLITMNFGSFKEYNMNNRFFNRNLAGGAMLDIGVYALLNNNGQMATVMLSLHSKQPKRGMISCEKGYIEVMEYPRAFEAAITYTESGEKEWVKEGDTQDALIYELLDMEKAINGDKKCMLLDYTKDVMDMMTEFRNSWNFKYPEEEL